MLGDLLFSRDDNDNDNDDNDEDDEDEDFSSASARLSKRWIPPCCRISIIKLHPSSIRKPQTEQRVAS